ncbi:MAG: COX15/CtaA family protein, partial [Acidimicrobiales bacterium]
MLSRRVSRAWSGRLSPRAYERITLLALIALGFIIVTGGAVRLTGSGLGCPKWPRCTSNQVVAPAHFRPMIEFGNRVVTGVVSIAVVVAVLGAYARAPRRRDLTWLASGLVVGVVAQIVLGGETVRHQLNPAFVMSHFILSMLIVWDAVVLHHRAGMADGVSHPPLVDLDLVRIGQLIAFIAAVTVVFGTVVTGAG